MSEKIEVIAELKDLISGKFKEINAQIDAMDSKLAGINGKGGGGIMGQVLGANLLTQAIMKAGSAFTDFAKESFYAYGKQEQFQTALGTLLYGNKQQAEALNNQLKQFALETPFELSEIQQGTRLLIAYGSSAGNVVDEMRMLGDVASGTAQPIGEIAYLYGTIRQQQKANLIDLKQFANRGIPIFKELAKVTKYSLQQLVEGGKDVDITFQDVEKAFKNMTAQGSQFGGMMGQQAQTLLGQTSNLSDAWEQLQANIGRSQSGILKDTIKWASEMVTQLGRIVERSNFFDEATKNVKDEFKINTSVWSQLGAALFGTGNDGSGMDKEYLAFNTKNLSQKKAFQSKEDRDLWLEYNKEAKGWMKGATRSTPEILGAFSDEIFNKFQTASKSGPGQELALAKFRSELARDRGEVLKQLGAHEISSALGVNKLAVIDKALADIEGVSGLNKTKTDPTKDAAGKPKDLEEKAKANKALQITVNIENLVREYTNEMVTPEQAKQMTVSDISKALVAAVNDIYAVGQQ